MRTRYGTEIKTIAETYQLDPDLVEAVVLKESSGNTDAFRFEPDFYNRYLKRLPECRGLNPRRISSSYGLMQVMYWVARELGYSKDHPPELLFVPQTGLGWGCRKLQTLIDWANGYQAVPESDRLLAALAAYNGGRGGNTPGTVLRNGIYARGVLKILDQLEKETHHP